MITVTRKAKRTIKDFGGQTVHVSGGRRENNTQQENKK
jgi:hypothetical protein